MKKIILLSSIVFCIISCSSEQTAASQETLPNISTKAISNITQTTASSGGDITTDGGLTIFSKGICWSTTNNPTIDNFLLEDISPSNSFTSNLTNLTPSTSYYVRAYAENSLGISYGNEVNFNTSGPTNPVNGIAVCDGTQPTIVVPITSVTGKIWMDRNLGASRAATSETDYESFGCLYQWGRGNDGHASVNWQSTTNVTPINGTTAVLSTTDNPGNGNFILCNESPFAGANDPHADWRNPKNNNLWQGVNGINNPCPAGYRLPTQSEFQAEINAYNLSTSTSAFNSIFKFPKTRAYREASSGIIYTNSDNNGGFMTSSVYSNYAFGQYIIFMKFNAPMVGQNGSFTYRGTGATVRCIKN